MNGYDPEDIAQVAQYAKTHADGPVWEAACRMLATLRGDGPSLPPHPGQDTSADARMEWILHEGRRRA